MLLVDNMKTSIKKKRKTIGFALFLMQSDKFEEPVGC